jgi:hypothetical protein
MDNKMISPVRQPVVSGHIQPELVPQILADDARASIARFSC